MDVQSYIRARDDQHVPFRLGWSHLGAHVVSEKGMVPSKTLKHSLSDDRPFFLSVGTVEIRKGISLALDAFDQLWAGGIDVAYVICGKQEWGAKSIADRIRSHAEYGKRLLWLPTASNADLHHLYEFARGLLFPSITEGFGLPLVEAAYFGLPAIVSDIPVFREIGGDNVTYFSVADSEALKTCIADHLGKPKSINRMQVLEWDDAMRGLLGLIAEDRYQIPILA